MNRIGRRVISIMAICTMMLPFVACGKKDNIGSTNNDKYTYVCEDIDMEDGSLYDFKLDGSIIYYNSGVYDEETDNYSTSIKGYDIESKTQVFDLKVDLHDIPEYTDVVSTDDEHYECYTDIYRKVGDVVYMLYNISHYCEADGSYSVNYYIVKKDLGGNVVELTYLGDSKEICPPSEPGMYNTYYSGTFDEEGNVFLLFESAIDVYSKSATKIASLQYPQGAEWVNNIYNINGKAYAEYYADGSTCYAPIEISGNTATYGNDVLKGFQSSGNGSLSMLEDGLILYAAVDGLYIRSADGKDNNLVVKWNSVDINGERVGSIYYYDEDRYLISVRDWDTGTSELIFLTRKLKSEVKDKTELTMLSVYEDYKINEAVVKYNKSQDEYHINYEVCFDYTSDMEYEDALTEFNLRVTSNNYDIVILQSDQKLQSYAEKGLVDDLTPYLEKSTVINKDDLYENVLEQCTYDGKLLYIPKYFRVRTLVGNAKDLDGNSGWTLPEALEYCDSHPDSVLFDYAIRSNVLSDLMAMCGEEFIDYKNKKCNYDSEDFINLLEYAAKYPDDYEGPSQSYVSRIGSGKILMAEEYVSNYESLQVYQKLFPNGYVVKGYPTVDGSAGHMMMTDNGISIVSKSNNKDAAWTFIEAYLISESMYDGGSFSIRKSINEKAIAEELKHAGEESGIGVGYDDDWMYDYHHATQEEIDEINEVIANSKMPFITDAEIQNIINEESQPFFAGQKSAQEVAKIIQSRLSVYVSENY